MVFKDFVNKILKGGGLSFASKSHVIIEKIIKALSKKLLLMYQQYENIEYIINILLTGKLRINIIENYNKFLDTNSSIAYPIVELIIDNIGLSSVDQDTIYFFSVVIECITNEIVEISRGITHKNRKKRITPFFMYKAISEDIELMILMNIIFDGESLESIIS